MSRGKKSKTFDLKGTVKSTANRFGYDIVRTSIACPSNLDFLDLAIGAVIHADDNFFFVQVGANDGVSSDPLYPTVVSRHLQGVLVEPLPDKFKELRRNYATESQLKFENCALAHENGEANLFRVASGAQYASWTQGVATFDRGLLLSHGINDQDIEKVTVPALTFRALVDKHKIDHISLLQIDTEGFDYEVIEQAFASSCFPKILHFEHKHLS